ncbi:Chemotaxis response regulator protein-glutamate methylesterase of group 1 operon [Thalassocella blandensis]|nr:Chemotaxis response regulator protein-glutamate methylesterase of group 1 operon [Thalassocella blandensis]
MPYSVLIVDDSSFFQTRLKEIINEHPDLNVVGVASNGQEAIDKAEQLKPDLISMDYEMPFLDGVTAVKHIMDTNPRPIIMFSSMTYEGARITLDALDAGALDFMNKNFAEVSGNSQSFKERLYEKLLTCARSGKSPALTRSHIASPSPAVSTAEPKKNFSSSKKLRNTIKLLAIGASTGGPVAVSEIITALPADFPVPIIVIQHMPENFTRAFSERMNRLAKLEVKEAEAGDRLEPGRVLVAPGGKQMMVDRSGSSVKIIAGDDRVNYKPSVDIAFGSAASALGSSVLGLVLTGMGADGCEGARLLKERGSIIWSQDKESSIVYGMPAAVAKANLTSCVLPLNDIANKLISEF